MRYGWWMDLLFLQRAVELAWERRGFCAPNPSVGAVVVRQGQVIAEGLHKAAGLPHAEVDALSKLGDEPLRDCTLYVSLEPCCHTGRTPPCTDLILKRGIGRVVYAATDPNPKVSGGGFRRLRDAGVEVLHFPIPEAQTFYESYTWWRRTGTPFTTLKLAISLDGKTAGPGGQPVPLTGAAANAYTHLCRRRSDVLLTTARTVLADNPRLNSRMGGEEIGKPVVVLDRLGRTPPHARLFQAASQVLIFVGQDCPADKAHALRAAGAEVISLAEAGGLLPLRSVLANLGERGFQDLWVEGGAALFCTFLSERLAQKALLYVAPHCLGAGLEAFGDRWPGWAPGARFEWSAQGNDALLEVSWDPQSQLRP